MITLKQELLIAWKWSSIVFGNTVAGIMLFAWVHSQTWERADIGAVSAISKAMELSAPKK